MKNRPKTWSMQANYQFACQTDKLREIRSVIRGVLIENHIEGTLKEHIVLAVDEACANAIIHGNQCDAQKEINIDLAISNEDVVVRISDVGNFIGERPEICIEEHVRNKKKGGLGLSLIYNIMDKVSFHQEDNIHICSLTKILPC